MKVILKENIKTLGKMGQIVEVADGYARNYLVPKGIAVEANTKNIRSMEHEKKIIQEKAKKLKDSAHDLASKLTSMTLTIKAKAGEEGKLFGSVTSMDIVDALHKEGIEIDKKRISLEEPIKRIGSFAVNVKIHPEISTQLNIQVVEE